MTILLIILGVLLLLSVAGFVVKTLFWLGVLAAIAFLGVAAYGAIKNKNDPSALN